MIATIVAYAVRAVNVTDYTKFFLWLRRRDDEVASYAVRWQQAYYYLRNYGFGERVTPAIAHHLRTCYSAYSRKRRMKRPTATFSYDAE